MKPRLKDLTSPAAVQAALDEFGRLGREAFLALHGFGRSRDFLVRNPRTGELADSMAIAAVALRFQWPEREALGPRDFSGGEATVVPALTALGFAVEKVGDDWSRDEVEAIVADYLSMLTLELTGQTYNKASHRRALLGRLNQRSEPAVEFKHCNISAMMLELGFPYLKGYKPRSNFQRRLLGEVVVSQVARHRILDEATLQAVQQPVAPADELDFAKVLTAAPQREMVAREPCPDYQSTGIKRDYLEREARNLSLGLVGEDFALRFERWRLIELGVGQLADKVEHVSVTEGDGLGYDIRSYEPDGRERYIEVKTTTFGDRTPFFVSANEVRVARQKADQFRLYRLYDFRRAPKLFELAGPIERHCALDAASYRASFS
jgi:hypothetical protein